jgi:hypothetical protein
LQTKALISQFIFSTVNEFQLSLSTIRDIIQSNALWSARGTNYEIHLTNDGELKDIGALWYGKCSCGSSPWCAYRSAIYDYSKSTPLFFVSGIYAGCYVVESLFQSDFRCFYNRTCLHEVQSYLYSTTPINVTALEK